MSSLGELFPGALGGGLDGVVGAHVEQPDRDVDGGKVFGETLGRGLPFRAAQRTTATRYDRHIAKGCLAASNPIPVFALVTRAARPDRSMSMVGGF